MVVRVRLFAILRERAGAAEIELDLPDDARVADALECVAPLARGVPLVMAVNRRYAPPEARLHAGDELALVPPVSGGAREPWVRVTSEPLGVDGLLARVRDPGAGAIVTFLGVTREVERLEYEAYVEMAQERLAAIAAEVRDHHGLSAVAAEHRVGAVALSEPSVVVAVSAPHRAEAFAGARELIDRIKAEAPIWKREVSAGQATWVAGTPPS